MGQFILGVLIGWLPLAARWYWQRERLIQRDVTYPPRPSVPQQAIVLVYPAGNPVINKVSRRNLPARRAVRRNRTTI